MPNVTIKTLASALNVSVATVSKAMKDSYEIGAETKQRVWQLAHQLNYIPNPYAGSLRKRKSKTIAIVLPEVADSFFSLAINGIEATAQEAGYHVLIYLTHESFTKEEAILKDFKSGRVDGVLMSVSCETAGYAHIHELCNTGMPIVFFDRVCEDVNTTKITTDDFQAGYTAAQHLIGCGCRKIALLSISSHLAISIHRMEGYKKALLDHGVPYAAEDVVICNNQPEQNYSMIKKALTAQPRPDGIIATAEKLTTHIYLACAALELTIPDDVQVISFSNQPTASILNPALTTITQPAYEMGIAASTILFKALSKPADNIKKESIVLPSALIVRKSTRTKN